MTIRSMWNLFVLAILLCMNLSAKEKTTYLENGMKRVEAFKAGTEDGHVRLYAKSGELMMYHNFQDGKPHGKAWVWGYNGGIAENFYEAGVLQEVILFDQRARIRQIIGYGKNKSNIVIYLDEKERMFFMVMTKGEKPQSPAYVYDQDMRDEYIVEFDENENYLAVSRTSKEGKREKGYCHYVTDFLKKNGMDINVCYSQKVELN